LRGKLLILGLRTLQTGQARSGSDGELNARADAYRQIGDLHMNNNDLEEAAKTYRKNLELDPSDSYTWRKYAHTLKRQGNLEGAMHALQKSQVANSTPPCGGSGLL